MSFLMLFAIIFAGLLLLIGGFAVLAAPLIVAYFAETYDVLPDWMAKPVIVFPFWLAWIALCLAGSITFLGTPV